MPRAPLNRQRRASKNKKETNERKKKESPEERGWIFGEISAEGGGRLIERLKKRNHVGGVGLRRGAFSLSPVEGEKCKCVYG